jgi:hypothetical protein
MRLRYRHLDTVARQGRHFARLFTASNQRAQCLGEEMGDDVAYPPSKGRLPHIADCCNGPKAP